MKIENDPNLSEQKKILDHHPHQGFPQHGKIVKSRPHLLAAIKKPKKA